MLELAGIVIGIVAASFIMLFGSRGLVDLFRGIYQRRSNKKAEPTASETQSGPTISVATPAAAIPSPAILYSASTSDDRQSPLSPIADAPTSAIGAVFVGRQRELGTLKTALENALSGHGSVAMLAGEPGIGKTRIAQELSNYARSSGADVLWGRSYEEAGTPPFWPWIEVTRSLVRGKHKEQLLSDMGSGAADVAEIVPDVKATLPDLPPPPPLEPEQARFRLFDSLTTFLTNISQTQPLTLVLEDLHWADTPSLRMLDFLSGRIADAPIFVVGAYRDAEVTPDHPLNETLANLSREPGFRLEALHRFSTQETRHLIEATGGHSPTEELVQRIQEHTDGNPLFVNEVVRLLGERDESGSMKGSTSEELAVPKGVRAVTRQRLRRLSPLCNQVLTTASVVGREFEFRLLLKLTEETESALSAALDEAVQAHLVEELPRQPGRYHFSHSLIQQAQAEELSVTQRVRLHSQIAEALEVIYGDEGYVSEHAAELAHHFAEAHTVLGAEKMVRHSIMAGEGALAAHAWHEALPYFQLALDSREGSSSWEGKGQGVDPQSAKILYGLARAQLATFEIAQGQESVDVLRRAFDAFLTLGDTTNAVVAATLRHRFETFTTGTFEMAARALDLVAPDSIEAGYLLRKRGASLAIDKDYKGAREDYDRALEIARREGDRILEALAVYMITSIHFYQGQWKEAVEQALRAMELAQSSDDLLMLVVTRNMCALSLINLGDGDEAQLHATAGLEAAERLRNSGWLTNMLRHNTALAILRGEWKVAQEFNARTLAVSPRDANALGHGALRNLHLGNIEESRDHCKQLLEVVPEVVVSVGLLHSPAAETVPLFGRVTGTTDLSDHAESVAEEVLSSPSMPDGFKLAARVGLALIAVQRIDAVSAKEQYSSLESQRGTQQRAVICCDRLLGLLSQTMGNMNQAVAHFEDALAFCRKAGYRPELAWTCCDYADCLLQREGEGDRANATSLLDESLAISTELGMRPLMERVQSRREKLGT